MANNHYASNNQPAMKTPTLLAALAAIEESPWKDIRVGGMRMDARGLALRLRPYGIKPRNIRWRNETGESVSKGYYHADFEDAWARYVPPNGVTATESVRESVTDQDAATIKPPSTRDVADVADVADFRGKGG
jgi:hypothetical protein